MKSGAAATPTSARTRSGRASASSSMIQPPMLEPTPRAGPRDPIDDRQRIGEPAADGALGEATARRTMAAIVEAGVGAAAARGSGAPAPGLGAVHIGGCSRRRTAPRGGARKVVVGQLLACGQRQTTGALKGSIRFARPAIHGSSEGGAANACRFAAHAGRSGRAGNERHRQSSPGRADGRRRRGRPVLQVLPELTRAAPSAARSTSPAT